MSYISKIDPETAGEKEKEVIRNHLAQGYRLTNEKLTLLHNAEAFKAIEDSSTIFNLQRRKNYLFLLAALLQKIRKTFRMKSILN